MKPLSITDTYTIQNNTKHYHFYKCLTFIEQQGKIRYGQKFKIFEEDKETILKLLIYAIQDQKMALQCNTNLSKGICCRVKLDAVKRR